MASRPITSWQIIEETMVTGTGFIFLGSKITADGDCSHEVKRHLLLGKKSYNKPTQRMKKLRHYFPNKDPYRQSYGFFQYLWMDVRVGL